MGVESGSGSKPNKHGNFVALKNASRVFRNGLFWFIGRLRNVSNRLFAPGEGAWGGGRDEDGRFEYKTRSQILHRQRIK